MQRPEHDRVPPSRAARATGNDDAALSRAARAALGWSLVEVSRRAGVSVASVLAAEQGRTEPAPSSTSDRLRRAYEEGGILFFDDALGRGIRISPR